MNVGWLIVALGSVVLGIGGYTAILLSRRRGLEQKLADFRKRSEDGREGSTALTS